MNDPLRGAAEQFLASVKDGNAHTLIDYYAEIFGEALAAPQQEPAAYRVWAKGGKFTRGLYESIDRTAREIHALDGDTIQPLYALPQAAPPSRELLQKALDALKSSGTALRECEAVLGGEYADQHGPLFELISKANDDADALIRLLEESREERAWRLVQESGKTVHSSDCATSQAPAYEPGPCDCDEPQSVAALAVPVVPQADKAEPEIVWSSDEEEFRDYGDVMAQLESNGELEPGRVIYQAEVLKQPAGHYYTDASNIFEEIGERAYEEVGEHSGDWPEGDHTDAQQKELAKIIKDWLDANVKVWFFSVANVTPHTLTAEEIAEYRGEPEGTSQQEGETA